MGTHWHRLVEKKERQFIARISSRELSTLETCREWKTGGTDPVIAITLCVSGEAVRPD